MRPPERRPALPNEHVGSIVKASRTAVAGLVLVLATAPALAGCAGKNTSQAGASGSPSASPSPLAPKDALAASFKQLGQTSFSGTIKDGDTTGEATIDGAHQGARMSVTMAVSGVTIKTGITSVGGRSEEHTS